MSAHKYSQDEMVAAYEASGRQLDRTAELIGCSPTTVGRYLRAAGIDTSQRGKREALTVAKSGALLPVMPDGEEPASVTWDRLEGRHGAVKKAHDARKMVTVKMPTADPVVLHVFGDLHIGNTGTDHALLRAHSEVVRDHPRVWGMAIGDLTDNWYGKIAHLWSKAEISENQELALFDLWLDMVHQSLLAIVLGNHDVWPTPNSGAIKGKLKNCHVLASDNVRLKLAFENREDCIISAHHKFKGSSMLHPTHASHRAAMTMLQDSDVVVSGHRHTTGLETLWQPVFNKLSWSVQVGSYKTVDAFAERMAFRPGQATPSVSLYINPKADGAGRVIPFLRLEDAVRMLG